MIPGVVGAFDANPRLIYMKLSIALLFLLILPLAAHADEPVAAPAMTATATVQPKRVVLSDLKPNKPVEITVTYVITNHTAGTQVVNRFCTLRPSISGDDSQLIPLHDEGTDASRSVDASDILIIEPGKQETLLFRVAVEKTDKGIIIVRNDESGEWSVGAWINTPKFLNIGAIYVDPLGNAQIEKLRPKLKGTKYSVPDFKLPPRARRNRRVNAETAHRRQRPSFNWIIPKYILCDSPDFPFDRLMAVSTVERLTSRFIRARRLGGEKSHLLFLLFFAAASTTGVL